MYDCVANCGNYDSFFGYYFIKFLFVFISKKGENPTFFQWNIAGIRYQYFILTDVDYHKDLLVNLLLFFQRKQIHFEELSIVSLLSKHAHSLEVDDKIQRLIDEIGT